jgi:hypothetical protein
MRDPLWYAPATLTLAAFGGAALIAVLLVGDRRFFMPRDTAIVAGVAAAALVAALVGVAALAGWIARLPRPGADDAVLASTVGGLLVNGVAWFLAVFGFAMPGLVAAEAVRGEVGLVGALGALVGGVALVGTAAWFSTTGRLVWLARADGVIVERSSLSSTIHTPLADVLGVEVHHWRHLANRYNKSALRLRVGSGRRFDAIPLGLPSTLASTLRDAERAAACLSVPRLPERDLGAPLATPR